VPGEKSPSRNKRCLCADQLAHMCREDREHARQARRAREHWPHVRRVPVRREQGDEVGVDMDVNAVGARSEVLWLM
jgi:hypothetical protein